MQRLSAMQRVKGAENRRYLAAHESLRLRALSTEPRRQVPMLGVLHRQAIARVLSLVYGEPIDDGQRARILRQHLREVRLAKPTGQSIRELETEDFWLMAVADARREEDLTKATFADETLEAIRAATLGAVNGVRFRSRHARSYRFPLTAAISVRTLPVDSFTSVICRCFTIQPFATQSK